MNSTVPYLLRALYEWVLDNECTPHIVVDASNEHAMVPMEYAKDGQIVLNISPSAVRDLQVGQEAVEFGGRFGGVAHEIYVPMAAVIAIYAKENGQGMWFSSMTDDSPPPPSGGDLDKGKNGKSPKLQIVK